ncbi:MAG: hypothetical protein HQK75_08595 [Candidatus Magnetomorum sp.]|nr:hypothetical protein [Candidatus Magnetomorum sp.]
MIKPQLPLLKFELPDGSGLLDVDVFKKLADEFKQLGAGSSPEARWFHQRRQEIIDALSSGVKLKHVLETQRDIRVLIHLWSTDNAFFTAYPITKSHLKQISKIKTPLAPSQLYSLIRLYFDQFDRISDLKYFCKYIRDHLNGICSKRRLSQDMSVYCSQKDILFEFGLKSFWEAYHPQETSLKKFFQTYRIPWDHRSHFSIASKRHFYVKPVEHLKLGEVDPIFDVLINHDIKRMPFKDRYSIGQTVSMLMMDKAANKNMPDNWRQFIIKLLGDPRMPKSSDQYQQGWGGVAATYEQQIRKWLSQMDLIVFLEILEEIGKQTGNDMIRRMFPARKVFLESLYKTGMIMNTRLFLSNDAVEFIEKRYDAEERPLFARISHKNKSVIHMHVGPVHLIEGTHNYSARLLDRLPSEHPIADHQKKRFLLTELATGLDQAYALEFKDRSQLYVVPHDIHNAWQRKLTEVFKTFDIHVNI